MKILLSGMQGHIAGGRTTLAEGFKIIRSDNEIFAFTSHDISDEIDGITYDAVPGLEVSDIVTSVGTSVGTLELRTLNDGVIFSNSEIFNGLWKGSEFELFRYNFENVSHGKIPLMSGRFGEVTVEGEHVVVELRDLRQFFQQKVGSISSRNCRYRVGDLKCGVDLDSSISPYTVSGTLTHVTSNRVFRDSARAEASDWFGEGTIRFLTGNNIGVSFKIRSYAANGTFTLALPVFSTVQVGDTYTAVVGCRGRFEDDCVTKFSNELNFGGEPHRKGFNGVVSVP